MAYEADKLDKRIQELEHRLEMFKELQMCLGNLEEKGADVFISAPHGLSDAKIVVKSDTKMDEFHTMEQMDSTSCTIIHQPSRNNYIVDATYDIYE